MASKRYILSAIIILFTVHFLTQSYITFGQNENEDISIDNSEINVNNNYYVTTDIIIHNFTLTGYLALTHEQKVKGLSVFDVLDENESMLFPYDSPGIRSFWMKGMKFPIDIFWLDENGKVLHIENSLPPCILDIFCKSYAPHVNAKYVLETIAGFAQKYEVKVDTDVEFSIPKE